MLTMLLKLALLHAPKGYDAAMSTPLSSASPVTSRPFGRSLVIAGWSVLSIWLAATVANAVSAGTSTGAAVEAIWGATLLIFVGLHTLTLYRPAGALAYYVIAVTVSFALEACSVATGFPFGFYTHYMPGPRALGIPFPVVAAWVMIGWVAWMLARVIVGECRNRLISVLATPVVATLIAGGYDLVIDPFGAARQMYAYGSPSGALGVPLSNYVGWLITGWVIFQAFALIERRFRREPTAATRSALLMPAVVWFGLGLQVNLGLLLVGDATTTIQGATVALKDIYETCAEMTWFMMGLVVVISVVRLYQDNPRNAA